MIEVEIIVQGSVKTFRGDYDSHYTEDWTEIIREMLDGIKEYEQQRKQN